MLLVCQFRGYNLINTLIYVPIYLPKLNSYNYVLNSKYVGTYHLGDYFSSWHPALSLIKI